MWRLTRGVRTGGRLTAGATDHVRVAGRFEMFCFAHSTTVIAFVSHLHGYLVLTPRMGVRAR